ncbi:hypothetical protein D3C77_554470 [compost metagenome]
MLLKSINTYEKAVQYIRDQTKVKKEKSKNLGAAFPASGRGRTYNRGAGVAKPDIPIVQSSGDEGGVSEEEFAELLKMAEQMQANKNKGSM